MRAYMTADAISDSSNAPASEVSPADFSSTGDDRPSTAEPTPQSSSRHIIALDGVRGLAILLVIVSHTTVMSTTNRVDRAFARFAEVGWTGVDLFFVLSGFLITGILLDQRRKSHYFRNFYARRVLRIFPLYYAFIFVLVVVVQHLPNAKLASIGRFQGSSLWYWLYLSNIKFSFHGFDNQILGVTWSLAVEEHFYLAWPLLILILDRRSMLYACLAIIIIALVLRTTLVETGHGGPMPYVFTLCRMDSLAMGAAIALLSRGTGGLALLRRHALVAGAICAFALPTVVIATNDYFWTNRFLQMFGFSLIGIFYSCLLIQVLTTKPQSLLARFFSLSVMRMAGKYSYCLYLIHAIFRSVLRDLVYKPSQFATIGGSSIPGQLLFYLLVLGCSFPFAIVSWNMLESRFLKMKRLFPLS